MDNLIEIAILICLIVVIILLLVEKVKIGGAEHKGQQVEEKTLPDVIGKVVIAEKETMPAWLANRKKLVEKLIATKAGQEDTDAIKNKNNDDIKSSDVIEQDDDNDVPPDDDRFVQAVSVEELTKVGKLLQQDSLDTVQERETAGIIQKIEGTEFFNMMRDSIDGASQKIAKLLDKSISEEKSDIPKDNPNALDDFDIVDFI